MCVSVYGVGADQCTLDEQCSNGYDDPPIVYAIESEPFNLTNTIGMVAINTNATDDRDITNIKIYVDDVLRKTCNFPGPRDIFAQCQHTVVYVFGVHGYYVEATDSGKNTFITRLTIFTVP